MSVGLTELISVGSTELIRSGGAGAEAGSIGRPEVAL